jgi:outer membrane protein OmpA-like peptidoglycan-associated protein
MFKGRASGWTFDTSSGNSLGIKMVAGSKGTLVFKSPEQATAEFQYASLGFSESIKGGSDYNITGSSKETFSTGSILVSSSFAGPELSAGDFVGFTLIAEFGYGAGTDGGTVTAMLLGIPLQYVPHELVNTSVLSEIAVPFAVKEALAHPTATNVMLGPLGQYLFGEYKDKLNDLLQDHAKAALIMRGHNTGAQLQLGVSASLGYVWGGKITQPVRVPDPIPGPVTIDVIPKHNGTLIHMPGDVLFGFDKWHIQARRGATSHAEDVLEQVAVYMRANPPRRVRVEGHTDEKGPPQYNMDLSIRRAQAVANWLLSKKLVDRNHLQIEGFGEEKPTAPNRKPNGSDDPVGRAKNRRVEIWLLK